MLMDMTELAAQRAKIKEMQNEFYTEARKIFAAAAQDIFKKYEIDNFTFRQFTPFWNDGDECVFGVNNEDVDINGVDVDEDEEYDYDHPVRHDIYNLLDSFTYDEMKAIFGDHAAVTIYSDGSAEVVEYIDHY